MSKEKQIEEALKICRNKSMKWAVMRASIALAIFSIIYLLKINLLFILIPCVLAEAISIVLYLKACGDVRKFWNI